jgi:heme exporter protein A
MNTAADGLSVDGVHVWRGDRHVLKGVSLQVAPRQLLHISGPNGTGKTTLLRVVCGLLRPEQGQVSWGGKSISSIRPEYQAALAYASHEPALKADLTALENLRFAVGLKLRVETRELRARLDETGVAGCADLPARVLSAGQRRRLPWRGYWPWVRPWLLDEPFTNLDAAGGELMSGLLRSFVEGGGAALVVAHHTLQIGVESHRLDLGS